MDDLDRIFEHFKDREIAVVGSAVKDYGSARDVDVLVPAGVDFPTMADEMGIRYNGWDLADGSHLRRANVRLPGVEKPVQILQNGLVSKFEEWPHAVRLRDGRVLNADKHFTKDRTDPNYVGWKRKAPKAVRNIYKDY